MARHVVDAEETEGTKMRTVIGAVGVIGIGEIVDMRVQEEDVDEQSRKLTIKQKR